MSNRYIVWDADGWDGYMYLKWLAFADHFFANTGWYTGPYHKIEEKPMPDVPALQDMVDGAFGRRPDGYLETRTENDTPKHYRMAIEPIEYILRNELDFAEGNVVKYVSRWREKGGIKDLEKARSYVELLIHEAKANPERYGL